MPPRTLRSWAPVPAPRPRFVSLFWILLGLVASSTGTLFSGTLAAWDASSQPGGSGNFGVSPWAPTSLSAHLSTSGMIRGAGVGTSGTGAARGWGGNAWTSSSASQAASAGQEISVTFVIESGFKASFTTLGRLDYRRSASGPSAGVLQYRVGTGSYVDIAPLSYPVTTSGGGAAGPISLAGISALQQVAGGQSVTFRVLNYGASSAAGTWYVFDVAGSTAEDFSIEGQVEPMTDVPLAISTAGTATTLIPGKNVSLQVSVTPATTPASTGVAVTADLSSVGGDSQTVLSSAGGNVFATSFTPASAAQPGTHTISFRATDAEGRSAVASLSVSIRGSVNIIHINDTHTRVPSHQWVVPEHGANLQPQFEEVGGVAVLTGKMLSLATARPDSLILDGGDISEGNPLGDWDGPGHPIGSFGNAVMVDFYRMLDQKLRTVAGRQGRGLDAMVVGNHDIRSINYLNNLRNQTDFPVISANICQNGTKTPYFRPYVIVEVNGNRIGILGYTTESADSPDPEINAAIDVVKCDWKSTDSTKIHFADYVNELRNDHGCNLVILLTHMGHSGLCTPTFSNPTPILVDDGAAKLPEVAVTGHWHTFCETAWQPSALNYKTLFTEAGSYTHYIGELLIDATGRYLDAAYHPLRHRDTPADPDVAAYVAMRKAQYAAANPAYGLDQVIGYTADDLLLDNDLRWWSTNEYPWSGNHTAGNWICDAIQWKAQQLFGACDLAIESGGGVRSDIPAGAVTYTQIYETFPWADDIIWRVNMTGQEILNYIREHGCSVGVSAGWHVQAQDGVPVSITHQGEPISPTRSYTVAINNYMYNHDSVPFSDPNPVQSTALARDAIVEFTSQFTAANPYRSGNSRYTLNTEFAGGYRGVITMMNDGDSKTAFEVGFIRLLDAVPETLGRRGTRSVPVDLVRTDGTIFRSNRLSENELYRSYLGFRSGVLKPGDLVEVWGKGGFYEGNPEFVDQEGIQSHGVEFKIVGHDSSLAAANYFSSIAEFWNDNGENHYVRFFARKAGTSTVTDQEGTTITVYDKSGYTTRSLPGSVGDLLALSGVPTSENYGLRFRSDAVALASTLGVTQPPPDSGITPVPEDQNQSSLNLSARAAVAPGSGTTTYTVIPSADAQVARGRPTSNYGSSTSGYVQSQSSADSAAYLDERVWYQFSLSTLPASAQILSARLRNYCWRASGASLPASLHAGGDSWTESTINWNNQPAVGPSLYSQALAASTTGVWYGWDVTDQVRAELQGDKTASFVLKATTEGSTDATPPSYGFDNREYSSAQPYLEVKIANGGGVASVTKVEFFYRYSSNRSTWSNWSRFDTVQAAPWTTSFTYPEGDGYYEFYSVATDSNGSIEPAPAFADQIVHRSSTIPAVVQIEGLQTTYDGLPHGVVVSTIPSGLSTSVLYNGSSEIPSQAGTYAVSAMVQSAGYVGAATATFTIERANQTIAFPSLGQVQIGSHVSLEATASSGLPVTFSSSDPTVFEINGNGGTVLAAGSCTVVANQVGGANYLPASASQILIASSTSGGGGGTEGAEGEDIPVLPWWAIVGALGTMIGLTRRKRKGDR